MLTIKLFTFIFTVQQTVAAVDTVPGKHTQRAQRGKGIWLTLVQPVLCDAGTIRDTSADVWETLHVNVARQNIKRYDPYLSFFKLSQH